MGSKKKRKSVAPADELPAKRPSSQQGRRSSAGGSGGTGSPLAWSADGVTVTLPADQALVLLGWAKLTVLSGEVAVAGAVLTPASGCVEVSADERCGGALLLEPGAATGTVPLAASGAAVFSLARAVGASSAAAGQPATPPPQQPPQQQQGAAAEADGAQRQRQLGFEVWLASASGAPPVPPPLPPLWQQAAAEVEETLASAAAAQQQQPAVIVVCGAKKVGKSTFARFLVNSLLSRHSAVAYLDTDCGQPEFTAPGLVSLSVVTAPALGPPSMHQRRPAAAFFVGDTSPANDPVRYLQYVRELYRWYCQHAAAGAAAAAAARGPQGGAQPAAAPQQELPPLVVNTHGWVKGMGLDVLTELLQGLPVSHLVQIAAANPKKNLPAGSFWLAPADGQPLQQPEPLHWLLPGLGGDQAAQPAASETSARSTAMAPAASEGGGGGGAARGRLNAVEQRALQWEALAQQCIDNCGLAGPAAAAGSRGGGGGGAAAGGAVAGQAGGDLGDRLAAAVPFEVDAADLEVQVLHSAVPPSQLYHALNGAVVGLCTAPPLQQQAQQGQQGQEPPSLPCLGLGIVRAADAARRRLYVLTAVPAAELESVAVLQLGRLELPASLLQTGAHMAPYLALFSLSSTGTGAGTIKSRNNLLRLSQM